jgi:hypothetical protein
MPAVAAGAGAIVTGASPGAVVADGVGADSGAFGDDELSLQAASASAQAAASRLSFTFIDSPPPLQNRIIGQRCSSSREGAPARACRPGGQRLHLPVSAGPFLREGALGASMGWLATYNCDGPPVACVAAS